MSDFILSRGTQRGCSSGKFGHLRNLLPRALAPCQGRFAPAAGRRPRGITRTASSSASARLGGYGDDSKLFLRQGGGWRWHSRKGIGQSAAVQILGSALLGYWTSP